MRMRVGWKCPAAALAAGLWCLSWAPPALAARVVQFEILVDGQVVLDAQRGDEGGASADTVWAYLRGLEFRPAKGAAVAADPGDPLRATLKGKVRIFARYGGDAEVDTLTLVRDKEGGAWKVDPKEVERTAKVRK